MKKKNKNTPKVLNEWFWPALIAAFGMGVYNQYQKSKRKMAGEDEDFDDNDKGTVKGSNLFNNHSEEDNTKGSDLFGSGTKVKGSDLFGGQARTGGTRGSDLFGRKDKETIPSSVRTPESRSSIPGIKYKKCFKNLKLGCVGNNVKSMQEKLVSCGFSLPLKGEDGFFGPETYQAVKNFQTNFNLDSDGIVGPKTFDALSKCKTISRPAESLPTPASAPAKPEEAKKIPSLSSDSVLQERNNQLENLVFERLVKGCK